jgi:aspartyl/glutamyl-tRNA(Asn/Gln) amidotransferase C subunit
MTNPQVDVKALAALARLEVSDEELVKLQEQIPGILAFVQAVENVSGNVSGEAPVLENVMRLDTNPHESGIYTETLLSAAPAREGNHIAVKQVISRKK